MNKTPIRTTLLSALCLAVVGCGGSGGTTTSAGGAGSSQGVLLVDTAVATEGAIRIRALSVMFEDLAGNRSEPLLASPVELLLADPAGTTDLLLLDRLPSGSWDTILVAYDRATILGAPVGSTPITPAFGTLRIPFDDGITTEPSGLQTFRVRHFTNPTTGTGLIADLRGEPGVGSVVESMSVDLVSGESRARFSSDSSSSFELSFDPNAELSDPSGSFQSSQAWLGSFQPGDRADLDGLFLGDDRFLVRRGSRRSDDSCELKVYGTVSTIDEAATQIEVAVAFLRDRNRVTSAGSGTRLFDVSGARIVEDQSFGSDRPRTFADLAVGQFVEVEFCPGSPDRAYEVEIEDRPGSQGQGPEIEARVVSVDTMNRTIQLAPRGDDPLLVGGVAVQSATAEVPTSAVVFRVFRGGQDPRPISLSEISSEDRVWLRGTTTAPDRVLAQWVRVRSERD